MSELGPDFKPMVALLYQARDAFSELIGVMEELEYPDDEPPRRPNNNIIPLRKPSKNKDT